MTRAIDPKVAQRWRSLPRDAKYEIIRNLSDAEAFEMMRQWRLWARPKQIAPPGNWTTWVNLAGRGYGKTRVGAEFCHEKADAMPGSRGFLLGATGSDVHDTMIWGDSGLMATSKPWNPCRFEAGKRRVVWANGAQAKMFSAEKPNRLRGPQHHWGWMDEPAAYQYPREAYDQVMLGLRLGMLPQVCFTTTPKPIELIMALMKDVTLDHELRDAAPGSEILFREIPVVATVGTSFENRENVSEAWYNRTIRAYEGTSLYDQEILAMILSDVAGALWKMANIETARIRLDPVTLELPKLPDFNRIVIAVDPAVSTGKASNETGIMACGRAAISGRNGMEQHGYLLEDQSGRWTPLEWATRTVEMYKRHKADRVVAEVNQGGDLVKSNVHTVDGNVPVKMVHATRGKIVRAEPVAAKGEQHKIHHVGTFGLLESQLTTYVPDSGLPSPDRMDAYVWGFTELLLAKQGAFVL